MDEVTASQLRSLEQQPGWDAYKRLADEMVNTEVEKFARLAMAKTEGGIDPGDLQYRRGVVRGIQMISRTPMLARREFEKAMANQEATLSA